ncbi:MAG TPA: DinB family protein [Mycobacteriales bacterium]|nr:DinB family protein [Mycobacteriales bacterium]
MTERTDPPPTGDERATLVGFLDYQRDTLLWKCEGLTGAELVRRTVPPSTLSLLGLVRHLTEVERSWFRRGVGGQDVPPLYYTEDRPDDDFDDLDEARVAADLAAYQAELAEARAAVANVPLDYTFVHRDGRTCSLRWVYVHMIEEYARHNGHADLLREIIDGATGE